MSEVWAAKAEEYEDRKRRQAVGIRRWRDSNDLNALLAPVFSQERRAIHVALVSNELRCLEDWMFGYKTTLFHLGAHFNVVQRRFFCENADGWSFNLWLHPVTSMHDLERFRGRRYDGIWTLWAWEGEPWYVDFEDALRAVLR